jgi:MFS family permease
VTHAVTAAAPSTPALPVRRIAAVLAGNALEFYDFLTYAFFAVQIGRTFFPSQNPTSTLLLSLATFGAGFLTRPLGGIVIGMMGDRMGRKPAMLVSFACMGVAMCGLALTPSYASIGLAAPILVLGFRLLQGFAVGGEVGPTTAYLMEVAPIEKRGLYASLQYSTQGIAVLAAGLIGVVLTNVLDEKAFEEWGWRVAFLLGTLIVPVGLVIRRRLPETSLSLSVSIDGDRGVPVPQARVRVPALGLIMLASATIATYVLQYVSTFAIATLHMSASVAFGAIIIIGLSDTFLSPLSGWLSDRVGRRRMMLIPWVLLLVSIVPAYAILTHFVNAPALFGATAVLAAMKSLGAVPILVSVTESLPARIRSGGLGITYALATSFFGGSAQFIVTWLIALTGNPLAPSWYVTGAIGIGLAAMLATRESAPACHVRLRASTLEDTPGRRRPGPH